MACLASVGLSLANGVYHAVTPSVACETPVGQFAADVAQLAVSPSTGCGSVARRQIEGVGSPRPAQALEARVHVAVRRVLARDLERACMSSLWCFSRTLSSLDTDLSVCSVAVLRSLALIWGRVGGGWVPVGVPVQSVAVQCGLAVADRPYRYDLSLVGFLRGHVIGVRIS